MFDPAVAWQIGRSFSAATECLAMPVSRFVADRDMRGLKKWKVSITA